MGGVAFATPRVFTSEAISFGANASMPDIG